jgi:hypothetical protein
MAPQWAAQWNVNSFTTPKIYTVSVAKDGRWACDCPAHRFAKGSPKLDCKHINKVKGVEVKSLVALVALAKKTPNAPAPVKAPITINAPIPYVVLQTRREICLEEE